jgi:hypothetical protein
MNNSSDQLLASGDDWFKKTCDMLNAFAEEKNSEALKRIVTKYASQTKTFCVPNYHAQDLNKPEHRLDDMLGGFPFTSETHPWPICQKSGLFMQPLVQLNLEKAGQLLGIDLATGVLQVWAPVSNSIQDLSVDIDDFLMRIIPANDMTDPMTSQQHDWRLNPSDKKPTVYHFMPGEDDMLANHSRVSWRMPAQMFGSQYHLTSIAYDELGEDCDDEFLELIEELFEALDDSPLLCGNNVDYLGGMGGQKGGEYDAAYGDDLLLRMSDGNGFYFAIFWGRNRRNELSFFKNLAIRA